MTKKNFKSAIQAELVSAGFSMKIDSVGESALFNTTITFETKVTPDGDLAIWLNERFSDGVTITGNVVLINAPNQNNKSSVLPTGELLQDGRTLYILHETGKFVKGEKEVCNKFYFSVQYDSARGITEQDAAKFATDLKKKSDMHDELISVLDELTSRVERDCSIGSDPKLMELLNIRTKARLLLQQASQD